MLDSDDYDPGEGILDGFDVLEDLLGQVEEPEVNFVPPQNSTSQGIFFDPALPGTEWKTVLPGVFDKDYSANFDRFPFTGPLPGPTFDLHSPLQILKQFITPDIVEHIVQGMNRNIDGALVDTDEFWRYIAILLLVTIHGKACAKDNWSSDPLYHTPIFKTIMSVSCTTFNTASLIGTKR
jgi:hypothetical protein